MEAHTSAAAVTYLTPEEYLAQERRAEHKSEYVDGQMVAMTGATRQHNVIAGNLIAELNRQLEASPCEVYPGGIASAWIGALTSTPMPWWLVTNPSSMTPS
ncbi:MAG: Uma2 family endonuclease [Anaerolineae bacterium]